MLDYYDISGCYILRPWSYTIWQTIQSEYEQAIIEFDAGR
jgi:prolyl-tRNA synthetase